MKISAYILLILILTVKSVFSQDIEDLKSINAKTKVQFVTPEALDKLSIDLRKYESSDLAGIDSILLDTYLSITSGYMINNHFKQAYEVYNKYLFRKENMLSAERTAVIGNAISNVSAKSLTDEKEESELLNKVNQLKEDNESLESKRLSFKRNFSFTLIILSSIFALMIVSAGIRMLSIRSKLRQSRDRMKNIHGLALIGSFDKGLRSAMKNNINSLDSQTKDFQQELKKFEQNSSPVKQSFQLITGIDKIIKEVVAKL